MACAPPTRAPCAPWASTRARHGTSSAAASPFSRRRPRSSSTCASASSWTCGPPSTTTRPAGEILDSLELTKFVKRQVTKLSGGTLQRLNVALAMVSDPELLILDEPSTGLDPRARERLWSVLSSWRDHGTTIVLSTHSMEEATALADFVFIVDRGRCVSSGTPEELISSFAGGPAVVFRLSGDLPDADAARLKSLGDLTVNPDRSATLNTARTDEALALLSRTAGCHDLGIRRPTLGDAYLAATGTELTAATTTPSGD